MKESVVEEVKVSVFMHFHTLCKVCLNYVCTCVFVCGWVHA